MKLILMLPPPLHWHALFAGWGGLSGYLHNTQGEQGCATVI